jgi:tetratricopeptide (TPR) repeat protein
VVAAFTIVLGALFAQSGECPSLLEQARTAYESRRFDVAAAEFERALTLCPDRGRVLLFLAQAQLMAQRLEPALQTIQRLVNAEPKNTDALKIQGDILYLLGREPEAEKSLLAALEVDPKHTASRYALGRIYYQQSRFTEAVPLFRQIIEQEPNHYRAHDNLALCYASLRQDSDAVKHFLKALDIVHTAHPEYDTVYANAANFFLDREQYQKAFQLGFEAAKRNPSSARNFFLTGKALVKLDKHDLSVKWFKQAAELDPTYTEPHYWLAQIYRRLGQAEDADRELQKFKELNAKPRPKR